MHVAATEVQEIDRFSFIRVSRLSIQDEAQKCGRGGLLPRTHRPMETLDAKFVGIACNTKPGLPWGKLPRCLLELRLLPPRSANRWATVLGARLKVASYSACSQESHEHQVKVFQDVASPAAPCAIHTTHQSNNTQVPLPGQSWSSYLSPSALRPCLLDD
jgi:hypothetical protein